MKNNPNKTKYCGYYDACYESKTGFWLENVCGNQKCSYCKKRPRRHKNNHQC